MASRLGRLFPHLIHLEEKHFVHPTWGDPEAMYGKKWYNYTLNYSIHPYFWKMHVRPNNEEELEGYNCTLGRVMRLVLYGNPELINTTYVRNGYGFE